MKEKIFTPEFLKTIKFILVKEVVSTFPPYKTYGQAKDQNGMTILSWNEDGYSCDYFGKILKSNTVFVLEKDGGTRTVFNGYVFNQDDVLKILSLTW